MNKLFVFPIILVLFVAGCSSDSQANGAALADTKPAVGIEKLEIYHFHGTHQCYSCITVGAYAEETVTTYFKDEFDKGIIVFGHINGDLPENQELVKKYGATGSSLWIGTYAKNGSFSAEQNTNVWYKIDNKEAYMTYLKGVIEQKLAGN
jgi:hypothetical protein